MLFTYAFILLLSNALATDPPSLNAGRLVDAASSGLASSESFVAQTQRLLSNFEPKEFISSIQQWPQKIKIQAIQNAILHGYLNSLVEQPEFLVGIGRWPLSVKKMVVNRAITDGNYRVFESVLKSLNPNQKEDQKVLENIFRRILTKKSNLDFLEIVFKGSYQLPADYVEILFLKAASEGDMPILTTFLKNLHILKSPEMISKYGVNADQKIIQKGLEVAQNNGNPETIELIQYFLAFTSLSGKSIQQIKEKTKYSSLKFKRWLVLLAYSLGDRNMAESFLSLKDNQIYVRDLIKLTAKLMFWDDFISIGILSPEEFVKFILNRPLMANRVQLFAQFLEKLRNLSPEETKSRNLPLEDLIRSYIFIKICNSGELDLINVFLENSDFMNSRNSVRAFEIIIITNISPENDLARSLISTTQIDAPTLMIYSGIFCASKSAKEDIVNFLLSKIDISANQNFLLNLATITGDESLVKKLLKYEEVLESGLDEAIQYAISNEDGEIHELLNQTKCAYSLLQLKYIESKE